MTGRRFESFEPHELRHIVDGLRERRRQAALPNVREIERLLAEAESVEAEHDEEHRLETEELMGHGR